MTQDLFQQGAVDSADRTERAQRAVRAFRAMQHGLTGYARALTGDRKVEVVISDGPPRTDGKKIYFRPPIALGDNTKHERGLCDRRDPTSLELLCSACATREDVLIKILHEMAHIIFGTFDEPSPTMKADALRRAIEESGTKYARQLRATWGTIPDFKKKDYINLASLISPYLQIIVNALEDTRVDTAMFKARRGTKVMFDAMSMKIFTEGVETDEGMVEWRTRPLNSQVLVGIFVLGHGYKYEGFFHPEVEEALGDEQLQELVSRMETARSAESSYATAFPILARLRELGFCLKPEEEDQEDDDESEEGQGSGGSSDSDSTDEAEGEESAEADEGGSADGEPGHSDSDTSEDADRGSSPSQSEDSSGAGSDPEDGDADPSESSTPDDKGGEGGSSGETDEDSGDEPPSEGGDSTPSQRSESDDRDTDEDSEQDSDVRRISVSPDGSEEVDEGSDSDGTGDSDAEGDSGGEDHQVTGDQPDDLADPDGDGDGDSDEAGSDDSVSDSGDSGDTSEGEADDFEDVEPVDTGPDKGEGGQESNKTEYGTPDDALHDVEVFGQHEEAPPVTAAEMADKDAVDTAIIQGLYFETPSTEVGGVREHFFGKPIYIDSRNMSSAWRGAQITDPDEFERASMRRLGIDIDVDVPEQVLGPALMEMRRVFNDNARAEFQRHLKTGRVNQRVLGKRAWAGDPRLFQKKRLPGKRSYAVLLGLDISGSTVGKNIGLAKRAANAQAELCHRMGIDFAIYAHTAAGSPRNYSKLWLDVYEIKAFDQPWAEQSKTALAKIASDSENLDGHGIEFYRKKIQNHPATDKIILYYSDGQMPAANYDEELQILQREIIVCKQKGITLMGVGIRTDSPTRHGLETVRVDDDSDLTKVIRHLQSGLLHNR